MFHIQSTTISEKYLEISTILETKYAKNQRKFANLKIVF